MVLLFFSLMLSACNTTPVVYDYDKFRHHRPQSILVLPPQNETNEVLAPYKYFSTISRPLGECGYYVFPVAVIDALMKENGMPSAHEMHQVPLDKIDQIIGADAVLYVTIEEWGQKYIVIDSVTIINTRFKLVDVKTGTVIWDGKQSHRMGSGGVGGDPIAMLITAAVSQIVNYLSDKTVKVARQANILAVSNSNTGLLVGPYRVKAETEHCLTLQ